MRRGTEDSRAAGVFAPKDSLQVSLLASIPMQRIMPRILVTGAAGFIGSHTVELLLENGHSVAGIDNLRTGREANIGNCIRNPHFSFHKMDILDRDGFFECVRKGAPDAIIHLAALVSVPESIASPELNFRLNVEATFNAAEAARLFGVRRLVFASSAAVYGLGGELPLDEGSHTAPISPYGAAKLASESLLLGHAAAYGTVVRIQRYFNVYGPRQDPESPYSGVISVFARQFSERKPAVIFGDGLQTRDFIHVSDVARANMIAAAGADIPTGTSNICTGQAVSLLDLARILAQYSPGAPAPTHAPGRAGDIRHSVGSGRSAELALDFRPERKLEEGLAELIQNGLD